MVSVWSVQEKIYLKNVYISLRCWVLKGVDHAPCLLARLQQQPYKSQKNILDEQRIKLLCKMWTLSQTLREWSSSSEVLKGILGSFSALVVDISAHNLTELVQKHSHQTTFQQHWTAVKPWRCYCITIYYYINLPQMIDRQTTTWQQAN